MRAGWAGPALAPVLALLAGCASLPNSCRGGVGPVGGRERLVFAAAGFDSLEGLKCRADLGEPAALLTMARRYEIGDGVPLDLRRAVAMYQQAATPIPPSTAIWSPPVTLGGRGQVLLIPNAGARPGDPEAMYRLGRMYVDGRGVARHERRGLRLIRDSAARGFAPAMKILEELQASDAGHTSE